MKLSPLFCFICFYLLIIGFYAFHKMPVSYAESSPLEQAKQASSQAAPKDSLTELLASPHAASTSEYSIIVKKQPVASYRAFYKTIEKNGITDASWETGKYQLPNIQLKSFTKKWVTDVAQSGSVQMKKRLFFVIVGSLAAQENQKITKLRNELILLSYKISLSKADIRKLNRVARDYNIGRSYTEQAKNDFFAELLKRVNIIPVSMAVAQAAEESGWGASRFAIEGNALFGQWTFGNDGITPLEQREEMGNYQIKKFTSVSLSIASYMNNLNSHTAYQEMWEARAREFREKQYVTGIDLIGHLTSYSERKDAYVKSIQSIIQYNNLQPLDFVPFSKSPLYIIRPQ